MIRPQFMKSIQRLTSVGQTRLGRLLPTSTAISSQPIPSAAAAARSAIASVTSSQSSASCSFTTARPVTADDKNASSSVVAGDRVNGDVLFETKFNHLLLSYSPSLQSLTVIMNRPDLHNAFNEHVISEISQLFQTVEKACTTDPSSALANLRAIVLTGAGASFSAGADLNWMKKMKTYTEAENLRDSKQLFEMFSVLHRCPVPVIGRVNGSALGGGVGLVAACNIAIAVKDAKFGLTEVKLGLSPAVISSFVMSKLTPADADYYFLTGERFDATEAKQAGLIKKVVENEAELDKAVNKVIDELALNSPKAVRATKQLLQTIRRDPRIAESEAYCTGLISKLRVSQEGQEGLNSFFEKRKASWIPAHLGNPKPKKPASS